MIKNGMTSRRRTRIRLCPRLGAIGILLVTVFVAMICPPAPAQEPGTDTATKLELSSFIPSPIDVSAYLRWHVDPTHRLTLEDIASLPDDAFVKDKAIPSFGYSRDVIWYRLDMTVHDRLNTNPLIELNPTYLNFIDVTLYAEGKDAPVWQTYLGDHVPASQRPFVGTTHVAALPSLEAGDYRMFIRVQSNSSNFLYAKLWPATDLITSLTYRNVAINVFFGLIVTLGIAYVTLGFVVHDRIVVLYGIWVFSVGTVIAIVNGIVLGDIKPETPWLNDFLLGSINIISYAAAASLWLHISGIGKRNPVLFKICYGYVALILVFLVSSTNTLYTIFGTYIVPSHSAFMALMCIYFVRQLIDAPRNRQLWIYSIVLVIPTIGAILLQLAHAGLIEVTPLRLALHQFTTLFHVVVMGILIALRLARMDRERISMSLKTKETTTLVEEQRNLISMLSHEFRTPLAVIQRSAEMLMLRLQGHKGDVQDRLHRVQLQAQKLARLVDIFLSKDGINDQAFSLARETVLLKQFMEEFVANTSRKDAEISVICHDTTAAITAYIDKTLVSLAITNLIETSRRFAHGKPIHIQLHRQSEWRAEISIPCPGAELADAEIKLIDDALFRHDVEAKSLRSALGLHISQRIVDAHGGSIKLRRQGAQGIELCLFLPCEEILSEDS